MADKKITIAYSETGLTVYCIVKRESDGYLLDDATGNFGASPADIYLALTEDTVIKGTYQVIENRSVWTDGKYTIVVYSQSGGSPSPVADQIIGSGIMAILSDVEVSLYSLGTDTTTLVNSNLELTGARGTLTADGTEQVVYENAAPTDNWLADTVNIDLTNMAASDVIAINIYTRIKSGGTYIRFDTQSYEDAQDGTGEEKGIVIQGIPNRYGYRVALQQSAGTYRNFDWERFSLA